MVFKTRNILTRIISAILLVTLLSVSLSFSIPSRVEAATGEQGVDVSFWQKEIDWNAVAASGVTFAFIRVGNLKTGLDKYFYQNMLAAQAAGIKTGVYIYSSALNLQEVAMEAAFVQAALSNVSVSFPVVYDIESKEQEYLGPETLALFANTFCALIEQAGYYPMVYANTNWFTKKLGPIYYDKWVAQWAKTCDVPEACIWQYSSTAKVPGIRGNMDRDIMIKDYTAMFTHTGFVNRNGFIYFLSNYKVYKGLLDLGTTKYYLDEFGHLYTGFLPVGDSAYFFKEDGQMAVGFTLIGDGLFCFGADGLMLKGLNLVGDQTYFFDSTGRMFTGWLPSESGNRYFETDGHMLRGLSLLNNKLYYFNEGSGIMQTGFVNIGGATYLFAADGAAATGFINDGINTYYFNPETGGVMAVGLVNINNATYYFDENGIMQTGFVLIDNLYFFFDVDGKLIPDATIDPSMIQ